MVLTTYGRSTGFCIDPIEKKPLNHFYPGTPVLSFGTAGCNLGCKFCQNWDISKSRETEKLSAIASPASIANAAKANQCHSVAFTYNDPVIWAEYAIDTAKECHNLGIKTVAVTAGYITPEARPDFFGHMDAANVDLKAFTEDFYFSVTASHLQPVLDTLIYLKHETDVWFEITNLIIPNANDSADELRRMCNWVFEKLGPDVPIHFSAFHPDYRMLDRPRTPPETLFRAHEIAKKAGIRFPYIGNIHDSQRQNTYCPGCGELLIQRDWYQLGRYEIIDSKCRFCKHPIPGHFGDSAETWGARRQPIQIQQFEQSPINISMPSPTSTPTIPKFTDHQKRALLELTAKTITDAVGGSGISDSESSLKNSEFSKIKIDGVFVSLHKGESLRGCCGMLGGNLSLTDAIKHAATRTALHDHRFPPVAPVELPDLTIDVSILSPSKVLDVAPGDRPSAIEVGRHGLRIRRGEQGGLLLPQVATEQKWNAAQFLQAVCRKAGLPLDAWQYPDVVLETFEGTVFGMPMSELQTIKEMSNIRTSGQVANTFLNPTQLVQLTRWIQQNFFAIQSGATPLYYAPDIPDANVCGLVITVQDQATGKQINATQIQMRPTLAMQSNLFQMTESLAKRLYNPAAQEKSKWNFSIAVLTDPVLAPKSNEQSLSGLNVDTKTQAILASSREGFVLAWDKGQSSDSFLNSIVAIPQFQQNAPELMQYRCWTLSDKHAVVSFNQQQSAKSSKTGSGDFFERQPALAGRFYPADDPQRDAMVEQLVKRASEKYQFNLRSEIGSKSLLAIMTPHAGLVYSGEVAAAVWSQIEIPRDVIVISPKHTRLGANWAAAPHNAWRLSNNVIVPGNPELAKLLTQSLDGIELDAAAHQQEHGIEVQLPFLHKLAPETRVTALAIGGGSFAQIQHAGEQLAKVIEQLQEKPLLVISSDMNHFADDQENRRRDSLALQAFDSLDAERLLRVCQENQISMCGVIPAAIVLETLRHIGSNVESKQIAYATSGEVSGQLDRVVGYAGTLLIGTRVC